MYQSILNKYMCAMFLLHWEWLNWNKNCKWSLQKSIYVVHFMLLTMFNMNSKSTSCKIVQMQLKLKLLFLQCVRPLYVRVEGGRVTNCVFDIHKWTFFLCTVNLQWTWIHRRKKNVFLCRHKFVRNGKINKGFLS